MTSDNTIHDPVPSIYANNWCTFRYENRDESKRALQIRDFFENVCSIVDRRNIRHLLKHCKAWTSRSVWMCLTLRSKLWLSGCRLMNGAIVEYERTYWQIHLNAASIKLSIALTSVTDRHVADGWFIFHSAVTQQMFEFKRSDWAAQGSQTETLKINNYLCVSMSIFGEEDIESACHYTRLTASHWYMW